MLSLLTARLQLQRSMVYIHDARINTTSVDLSDQLVVLQSQLKEAEKNLVQILEDLEDGEKLEV